MRSSRQSAAWPTGAVNRGRFPGEESDAPNPAICTRLLLLRTLAALRAESAIRNRAVFLGLTLRSRRQHAVPRCPAYLNQGRHRQMRASPAEVRCRFTTHSTDGPRCTTSHQPIEPRFGRRCHRFGVLVWYWRDEPSIAAWHGLARRAVTRADGPGRWYEAYTVHVARVERACGLDHPGPSRMADACPAPARPGFGGCVSLGWPALGVWPRSRLPSVTVQDASSCAPAVRPASAVRRRNVTMSLRSSLE